MTDLKHLVSLGTVLAMCCPIGHLARAQAVSPVTFSNCARDKDLYCSEKQNSSEITNCLVDQRAKLSVECKADLEKFIILRTQTDSRGGGALSAFGGLNAMGPSLPLISYDGRMSPGGVKPTFTENKGNISLPVYRGTVDTLTLSLAGGDFHLGSPVDLDSGMRVPSDLYRAEMGAQLTHQLADRKSLVIRTSVGLAGDQIFEGSRDLTFSANVNYGFPGSEKSYWIMSVFFSNNSAIGNYVPIPGVAYTYKTSTFTGMFGFPITSLQWTPVAPWAFTLALLGPSFQSEITYGHLQKFQVFAATAWTRQNYIPSERTKDSYRLTIEETKSSVGLRSLLWPSILGELQAGWAFDRSIYIGKGLFNKSGGSKRIDSDLFISYALKAKF